MLHDEVLITIYLASSFCGIQLEVPTYNLETYGSFQAPAQNVANQATPQTFLLLLQHNTHASVPIFSINLDKIWIETHNLDFLLE